MDLSAIGAPVLFFAASAQRGHSGIPPPGTMMTCGKIGNPGFIPHILSKTRSVFTQHVKELILRKLCCPGLQKYLEQRARSEEGEQRDEEGQGQEADLHGGPPSSGGGDERGLGTRSRAAGSEGSVRASPPWPGLCSFFPSSLRVQVRPPGKGPWRPLFNPLCLCIRRTQALP